MSNSFNNHFSSLKAEDELTEAECQTFILESFKNNKVKLPTVNFDFREFDEKDMLELISSLDNSSSSGCSVISVKLLKANCIKLLQILLLIFNKSLSTGKVPDEWKKATFTSLYKKREISEI